MTRKNYESPEVEIEKFTIYTDVVVSNPGGLEDGGDETVDDGDFDF